MLASALIFAFILQSKLPTTSADCPSYYQNGGDAIVVPTTTSAHFPSYSQNDWKEIVVYLVQNSRTLVNTFYHKQVAGELRKELKQDGFIASLPRFTFHISPKDNITITLKTKTPNDLHDSEYVTNMTGSTLLEHPDYFISFVTENHCDVHVRRIGKNGHLLKEDFFTLECSYRSVASHVYHLTGNNVAANGGKVKSTMNGCDSTAIKVDPGMGIGDSKRPIAQREAGDSTLL